MATATMDTDDDMIMLIVGDATDETQSIKVKEENEIDGQANNEESYGSIKDEADYLEDDLDDGDYLPKKRKRTRRSTQFYLEKTPKTPKKEQQYYPSMPGSLRRRMLKPSERKSYVQDLIKECPELKDNQKRLIKILASVMQNTKPPTPPEGFYRIEEGTGQYVCDTCEFVATNVGAISRHYQDHHGVMYLVCYACGVNFRSVTNLYKHEKKCLAPDAVIVLKARAIAVGAKGSSRPYLPPHIRRVSKNERNKKHYRMRARLPCSYCRASFKDPRALDAHENLHRGERPYTCDYCMAPYGSYLALSRHRKTHEQSQFICDYCGKTYKNKITIKEHIQHRHSEVRKYVCGQCDKQFMQKHVMERHIQKFHENLPPPCPCQLCPKRYARNTNLRVHMKKAHGVELITRKMLHKSLPKLTNMELEQVKVVKKDELQPFPYVVEKANKEPKKNKKTKIETTSKTNKKAKTETISKEETSQIMSEEQILLEFEEQILPEPQTQTLPTAIKEEVVPIEHDYENKNSILQKVIVETNEEVSSDDSRMIVDISNLGLSADVLRFVQKIQAENKKEVVLVDHGKLVHLVESESDALRLMEQLQYNDASVEIEDISKYSPESDEHQTMDPIEAQLRAMESGADTSKDKLSLRKIRKKKI